MEFQIYPSYDYTWVRDSVADFQMNKFCTINESLKISLKQRPLSYYFEVVVVATPPQQAFVAQPLSKSFSAKNAL